MSLVFIGDTWTGPIKALVGLVGVALVAAGRMLTCHERTPIGLAWTPSTPR